MELERISLGRGKDGCKGDTYQKLPGLVLGSFLVVLALVVHYSARIWDGAAVLRTVLVRIIRAGLFGLQVRARGTRHAVGVEARAGVCLVDVGNGAVLPSCLARDTAAGAWREWRRWRDDGIMSVAVRGPAGTICPCAVLARICVFLVVLLCVLRLAVGLGGRQMAVAMALGVCGRTRRRGVSGFHARRTVMYALRCDGHPWQVTTNLQRIESGWAEHDIGKPSGEDKKPKLDAICLRESWPWCCLAEDLGMLWAHDRDWRDRRAVWLLSKADQDGRPGRRVDSARCAGPPCRPPRAQNCRQAEAERPPGVARH